MKGFLIALLVGFFVAIIFVIIGRISGWNVDFAGGYFCGIFFLKTLQYFDDK